LTVPQADLEEVVRLLGPTLAREQGFFARTLRLAPSPAPEWLKARRADGTISIGNLTIADSGMRLDNARVLWDATKLRLAGVEARLSNSNGDGAAVIGDAEISLDRSAPHLRFDGKLTDLPYKSGNLDFDGVLEADGLGAQILATLRGEGRLRGRSISFSPDVEFRSATACFSVSGSMNGLLWKLGEIEALQGGDVYTGSGVSQGDGKLVLDLNRGGRPMRLAASVF
jgi:hypothetical protein